MSNPQTQETPNSATTEIVTNQETPSNDTQLATNNVDTEIANKQAELDKLKNEVKDKKIEVILAKNNIKPEFQDYVKFKLADKKDDDFDNAVKELLKTNPGLREQLNTGGTTKIITTNKPEKKVNPLLNYKEKNKL